MRLSERAQVQYQGLVCTPLPVVSAVAIPPLLVQADSDYVHDHPSIVAQGKPALGMTVAEAAELMGMPTVSFLLDPAHTEVWYFDRPDRIPLWIGSADNRLIWLRYTNSNYRPTGLMKRSLKAAETRR